MNAEDWDSFAEVGCTRVVHQGGMVHKLPDSRSRAQSGGAATPHPVGYDTRSNRRIDPRQPRGRSTETSRQLSNRRLTWRYGERDNVHGAPADDALEADDGLSVSDVGEPHGAWDIGLIKPVLIIAKYLIDRRELTSGEDALGGVAMSDRVRYHGVWLASRERENSIC